MKNFKTNIPQWLTVGTVGLCATLLSAGAYSQATATADADALGIGVGISSASANPSSLSEASGGSATAYGGTSSLSSEVNLNQVFEASRRSILPPSGLAPTVPIPQIFQAPTIPAAAKAIPLSLTYMNRCMPVASGGDLEEMHVRGLSKNTDVVFLPHPNYLTTGEVSEDGKRIGVGSVRVVFPEETGNYTCLGIMSVAARKKRAGKVQMFGILNDAQHFVKNKLSGFPDVELLCAQTAVGANIGMRSGGLAGALSPGLTKLGNNSSVLLSLLGGITGTNSNTYPGVQLGMTCIVARAGGGTEINISELNKSFGAFVAAPVHYIPPTNGNGGKKAYGADVTK